MVSIIKNQLLKHLSRFTKNLSADKINFSTFKGEGELSNLELDECVLTELLELPSWLRLTGAWCNKVSFRIQWTKLKNVPIVLSLDEVNVTVETCEELRSMGSDQSGLSSYAVPGKYSIIHKVIDGITVTVNTVNVTFNSPAFTANVQIQRIKVESKSPLWEKAELRMTRLKEQGKGQILIFKELEWQTLRVEAKSTKDKNLTPLRLLTNQAKCRITIKKRLSDSFIMGSRLAIILDDLLWVLTDSQLKAALHFLDSLADLVQKATQVTRKAKAARKLEELPEYQAQLAQQERVDRQETTSPIAKLFSIYDVVETSYHFLSQQIILHLCDDQGPGRSCHPNLKDGAALQINIQMFQIDYYPYHLAISDRTHWPMYKEELIPHTHWQSQSFNAFKTKFLDLLDRNKSQHVPLSRSKGNNQNPDVTSPEQSPQRSHVSQNRLKQGVLSQFKKIMTTCVIIRVENFTVYKVTTSGKKQALKEFISAQRKKGEKNAPAGDRDHMSLPEETSIIHAEFIYYYYPDDVPFPLPPPKFYVQFNPIQIIFDVDSCLWFNSFALNLHQSLQSGKPTMSGSNLTYIDVKVEAILPRVIFESGRDYISQKDRPKTLTFQVTRATITNVRSLEQSSRADLAKCVDSFHMGSLFFGSDFPSKSNDFYIVTQKFLDHISTDDNVRNLPIELDTSSFNSFISQLSREFLWLEAKDVWCVTLDPVWAEFTGARAVGLTKPIPLLDALPVTIWVHANMDPNSTVKVDNAGPKNADIHALAYISNLVSVQLNHYQYLFLLRLAEEAKELATYLSLDTNRIMQVESSGSLAVGAIIPQLEVTFVMPSHSPGKESSGGDAESFIPDSSSLVDDAIMGSTATVWQKSSLSMNQWSVANGYGLHTKPIEEQQTITKTANFDTFTRSISAEMTASTSLPDSTISNTTRSNKKDSISNIVPNNINVGFSSMKKGFNNLMTSIDIALKPSPDDMSDSMSVRSDGSSDSERFVFIASGQDNERCPLTMHTVNAMFKVNEFHNDAKTVVEVASEVIEEESTVTTTSDHSITSSCRRKDIVSVSTFKLTKVEFLQQSVGYSSSMKIQVGYVSSEDCTSIPWDEFQSKFSSRTRAWNDPPTTSGTSAKVKLRLDHDVTLPTSKSFTSLDFGNMEDLNKYFKDFIDVHVNDLTLDLSMSTVTGLTDLIEDEIIPIPIPLQVTLNNVQLHLIEDRPPVHITSPGPVPIDLNITHMFITRSEDGIFNIIPLKPSGDSSESITTLNSEQESSLLRQQNQQLKQDVEELRRRLTAFERISEENRVLRRAKEETDVLRSCLVSAQDETSRLLDEKRKLLEDVKRLQEERMNDRGRMWNSKR
ncbi:bridge-like lipid transfer protein family member 3B isoform X2 [Onthophagus taurus]|uniref:bridge-like lipid transfer protein family member 3B isoform X2 n=1 Tax=Onthophagus taurus TaxID=166361 RepID=UPI000C1FF82B|nr:UHRF1-binding protein 1 isoform X3 [Onthophagus taurus]